MQTAHDLLKDVVDSLNHLPNTVIRKQAKHRNTYEICSQIDKFLSSDKLRSYSETLVEISIMVGHRYNDIREAINDSMEVNSLCIKWAEEFEKLHWETDWDANDWIDTVVTFAENKIKKILK